MVSGTYIMTNFLQSSGSLNLNDQVFSAPARVYTWYYAK
jgi:hypothetical protein